MKITMDGLRFNVKLSDVVREQFFVYNEHVYVRLRASDLYKMIKCFDFNDMDVVELSEDVLIEPVEAELVVSLSGGR